MLPASEDAGTLASSMGLECHSIWVSSLDIEPSSTHYVVQDLTNQGKDGILTDRQGKQVGELGEPG